MSRRALFFVLTFAMAMAFSGGTAKAFSAPPAHEAVAPAGIVDQAYWYRRHYWHRPYYGWHRHYYHPHYYYHPYWHRRHWHRRYYW